MSHSSDLDIQTQNAKTRRMAIRLEILGWIATIIAVAGVVLNNRQSAWCFGFWLVSNSLTAVIHLRSRLWALTARDLIFLALAVHGWWCWTH
jgi:nicotinamide riboside transporter PnuC